MNTENARPNLLVIGAGKAGSTSLHRYLGAHPEIFASRQKELMYFSSCYERGPDWYRSHFPERDGISIYFESTPQYSFRDEFPEAAARIYNFNPRMKLLYIVREPLQRIISHFNHWSRTKPRRYFDIASTLGNASERRFFVDRTRYNYQIDAYRQYFQNNLIRIVFLEDLKADFANTMNGVFRFLDVSECAAAISPKVYNSGSRPDTQAKKISLEDIPQERREELQRTLSKDVQILLTSCHKPVDFWGKEYV